VHKQLGPAKSILLYGSTGTGKTMLTHSVVSETGAVFFDLSLSNVMGKVPLNEMKLFLHMVFKVAKTMAPSVIYIDQIEKIFLKQKNKKKYGETDEDNETTVYIRTFKKMLISQLKAVKPVIT
jgi:ATP-dependent 26S proteasome regulatory subunit